MMLSFITNAQRKSWKDTKPGSNGGLAIFLRIPCEPDPGREGVVIARRQALGHALVAGDDQTQRKHGSGVGIGVRAVRIGVAERS